MSRSEPPAGEVPEVTLAVVTHQAADDLPDFLEHVSRLEGLACELIVVDCASRDGSAEIARRHAPSRIPTSIHLLPENLGFAGGMNHALRHARAPYLLTLNADVRPRADFALRLLGAFERETARRIGAVTGRLERFPTPGEPSRLDACGMRLTTTWRHLDRGSGEPDIGQWQEVEEVFGGTGAATLFSREALEDVAIDGEFFLEEFHSFREDAELCFRLQERGWTVLYEPSARALHRRLTTPRRRRALPAKINYHSLKNRYLLRAYHQTPFNLLWTFVPVLWRDLLALGYVLLRERSSLAAYGWLWSHRRAILDRRRRIQDRRTTPVGAIDRWFLRQSRSPGLV